MLPSLPRPGSPLMLSPAEPNVSHLRGEPEDGVDAWQALQEELCEVLIANGREVVDMFRAFDVNQDGFLSVSEIGQAIAHLSIDVPPSAIQALYNEIDQDASGDLTLHELNDWLHRKLDEKEKRRQEMRARIRGDRERIIEVLERSIVTHDQPLSTGFLKRILSQLGYETSQEMVERIFDDAQPTSGRLLLDDIRRMLWSDLKKR